MLEQTLLALPLPAAPRWLEHALLDEWTVQAVAGLNRDFLVLAGELAAARPGMPVFGLPGHRLVAIAQAAAAAGGRLQLPYALFDLRFRDARFWQSQAAGAASVHDARSAAASEPGSLQFVRAALTFAWHLVQKNGAAARLVLGVAGDTAAVVANLPVGSLDALARRSAPMLAARFCTHERFWELLVEGATVHGGTVERLARLSLLGQQLQGTDAARARLLHRRARRGA